MNKTRFNTMKRILVILCVITLFQYDVVSQELVNLAGEWSIKLDPDNKGENEEWFKSSGFDGVVRLPGCIQEQGYGDIPDIETIWWKDETLEAWFNSSPWLEEYKAADNFKTQAWLIPDRHYLGAAWFANEISIPENWAGKHITLYLERCHWETKLWIDGEYFGSNLSLGTPHIYDLSNVKPGKYNIVLCVDNSEKVNLGRQPHSVSEQTAGTWNGIVGALELRAEAPVWIDFVQLFPDIENKMVQVKGSIGNLLSSSLDWELDVQVKGYNNGNKHCPKGFKISVSSSNLEKTDFSFEFDMGEAVKLWDEFDPNLYKMNLTLHTKKDGQKYTNTKEVSFGMRKFEAVGRQFKMNNILTFLRGNTDCAVTPKTGYSPMDVESWRKIWKAYKDFGLNMARFHSWCPPEAAFIAADEMGIYLAPEVGEWVKVEKQSQFDFLQEEALEILKTYGNYSSFIQMGLGNEISGNTPFFEKLIKEWKATDSRHLYTIKANTDIKVNPSNIDYEVVRAVGRDRQLKLRYQGGWPPKPMKSEFNKQAPQTSIDWDERVASRKYPLIQHETAQICAYPDVMNEIRKYSGYLNPTYLEIAQEQLQERGMLEQLPDFVEASGKWQVELTREEFEAAYRTKELAGFHWLSLGDFTGQNTAPVGFTDAFYDAKPYVEPSHVRQWNAPTVLLACMDKRILTTNEDFNAKIKLSHYGKETLLLNDLVATLQTTDGQLVKRKEFESKEFVQGSAWEIGDMSCDLNKISVPAKLILKLESKKNKLVNKWNLWVFPDEKVQKIPNSIVLARKWDKTVEKKLMHGKTVLLLPQIGSLKGNLPICFTNHYWTSFGENDGQSSATGLLIDNTHPVFSNFPTEKHTNWQWWDLLTRCQPMILDSDKNSNPFPKNVKPLVQPIDTWKINRKLALVMEVKVGKGKLLVCSIDIETDLDKRPATKQFRKGLVEYMLSDAFNPQTVITVNMIKEIFSDGNVDKNNASEGNSNLLPDG